MKRTRIAIDDKLIREAMRATGIKTRSALVDYALRDFLRLESPKRSLELNAMERKHREGYKRKPVKWREFGDSEAEQVWVEPYEHLVKGSFAVFSCAVFRSSLF